MPPCFIVFNRVQVLNTAPQREHLCLCMCALAQQALCDHAAVTLCRVMLVQDESTAAGVDPELVDLRAEAKINSLELAGLFSERAALLAARAAMPPHACPGTDAKGCASLSFESGCAGDFAREAT